MMNEFVITTIIGVLSGVAGWVVARRKNLAEAHISELDAVEKAVAVWRELSEQLQKKYEMLLQRQDELEKEMQVIRRDNKELKAKNKELVQKLKALSDDV